MDCRPERFFETSGLIIVHSSGDWTLVGHIKIYVVLNVLVLITSLFCEK